MNRDFHQLRVLETRREINGMAKTIKFDVPDGLKEAFAWQAGQHLSLRFVLDGREVRRSYSISTSPASRKPLQITVKRVKDGLVSNHVNDAVEAGSIVEVMPPFGGFCLDVGGRLRRTHYFFGAGSGITPLIAMIQSVLLAEPWSVMHLALGNRNSDTILFREQLADHARTHPDRLNVCHVLSRPSLWSGLEYWCKGTVDKAAVEAFIEENPPYAQDALYHVCGPGDMNRVVRATLLSLDVPSSRIHMESYGGPVDVDESIKGIASTAAVSLGGDTSMVPVAAAQTLLEAVRAAGLTPPFSCQSGVCGACRARLTKGSVHMRCRMALDEEEIAENAILTCQSVATTGTLAIRFG